jgi:HSP20 family molecular chaperone IbpA
MNHDRAQPIRVASGDRPAIPAEASHGPRLACQTPLIDIHEGPEGLILEADLPGATEETVTIQLHDNVLSLQAHALPYIPEGARALHEEYRVGEYARAFILSEEIERSRITAEFLHGVLRLTLPSADRITTRRIEIQAK